MSRDPRAAFDEAIAARPVRLDTALLAIAAHESTVHIDPESTLVALDELADAVPPTSYGPAEDRLRSVLGRFRGEPGDYDLLASSMLPAVLRRGRGLPILLSAVWLEVARRAGISAHGVALPGHYVVAVGADATLVDPWRRGEPLSLAQVEQMLTRGGHVLRPEHLAPADPIATIARVLANIRAWSVDPLRARTRLWAIDLALRLPGPPPALMRERGIALSHLGHLLLAARWLEEYAEIAQDSDPVHAAGARALAARCRARLN